MEENTVDLYDYMRVIWRRKIIIIVVILVGLGIGVGVTNSRSKAKVPVKYCAEVIIKIGKKVNLAPFTGVASTVDYIQSPANLVTIIPLKYWPKVKDISRYHLEVEQVGRLGMLKAIVKGHDKGVEKVLKELVDMLIDEHRMLAEIGIVAYKNLLRKLEENTEMLKKEIALIDVSVKEMKRREGEYLVDIESVKNEKKTGGDRSAFLNMLYLKTIDKEREVSARRAALRDNQMQLFTHRITLGNLEEYKTEKFGEIKNAAIKSKEKEEWRYKTIAVGGIVGLIMSLFIAFCMESIEESKLKRKRK